MTQPATRLPVRQPKAGDFLEWAVELHMESKAKRLLMALAGYCDAGIDDPTLSELERYSHQSPATVVIGLLLLEKQGYITVEHEDKDRYKLNAQHLTHNGWSGDGKQ